MRNQKHCFVFCQFMNHIHDQFFTLHINIGSCLIKNIYSSIVQQCSGNHQSLTLSAGQIAGFFQQLCLKTILCLQKSQKVYFLQNCIHLFFCRIRFCHTQIFLYSSFKQITIVTDQYHMFHQI